MILCGVCNIVLADLLGVHLGLVDRELGLGIGIVDGEDLLEVGHSLADIAVAVAGSVYSRRGLIRRDDRRSLDGRGVTGSVGEDYLHLLLALGVPIGLGDEACLDGADIVNVLKELYRLAVVAGAALALDAVGGGCGGVLNVHADGLGNAVLGELHLMCAEAVEHERLCLHRIARVISSELVKHGRLRERVGGCFKLNYVVADDELALDLGLIARSVGGLDINIKASLFARVGLRGKLVFNLGRVVAADREAIRRDLSADLDGDGHEIGHGCGGINDAQDRGVGRVVKLYLHRVVAKLCPVDGTKIGQKLSIIAFDYHEVLERGTGRARLMGQNIYDTEHLYGGLYRLSVAVGVLELDRAVIAAGRAVNGLGLPCNGVLGCVLYLGERILGSQSLIVDGEANVLGLGLRCHGIAHDEHDLARRTVGLDRQKVGSLLREAHIRIAHIACLAAILHECACIRCALAKLGLEDDMHPPIHAEHNDSGDDGNDAHYRKSDREPPLRLSSFFDRSSSHFQYPLCFGVG